eukprot:772727-Amorphochlora_amoeboformis.AAC.1
MSTTSASMYNGCGHNLQKDSGEKRGVEHVLQIGGHARIYLRDIAGRSDGQTSRGFRVMQLDSRGSQGFPRDPQGEIVTLKVGSGPKNGFLRTPETVAEKFWVFFEIPQKRSMRRNGGGIERGCEKYGK